MLRENQQQLQSAQKILHCLLQGLPWVALEGYSRHFHFLKDFLSQQSRGLYHFYSPETQMELLYFRQYLEFCKIQTIKQIVYYNTGHGRQGIHSWKPQTNQAGRILQQLFLDTIFSKLFLLKSTLKLFDNMNARTTNYPFFQILQLQVCARARIKQKEVEATEKKV